MICGLKCIIIKSRLSLATIKRWKLFRCAILHGRVSSSLLPLPYQPRVSCSSKLYNVKLGGRDGLLKVCVVGPQVPEGLACLPKGAIFHREGVVVGKPSPVLGGSRDTLPGHAIPQKHAWLPSLLLRRSNLSVQSVKLNNQLHTHTHMHTI